MDRTLIEAMQYLPNLGYELGYAGDVYIVDFNFLFLVVLCCIVLCGIRKGNCGAVRFGGVGDETV